MCVFITSAIILIHRIIVAAISLIIDKLVFNNITFNTSFFILPISYFSIQEALF